MFSSALYYSTKVVCRGNIYI